MTDHLTAATLSAFADGELPAEEAAAARGHLDTCLPCASTAVDTWLLKSSIGKSGHRYSMSASSQERLQNMITGESRNSAASGDASMRPRRKWIGHSAWIAAAAMFLVLLSWTLMQFHAQRVASNEYAALAAEASDLHIAMLASSAQPQVVSSDRHTVKPWFQGKLPFSFNLPETLPADMHLDGANLAYLGDRPVAQLLFSIGRHRASVFVEQRRRTLEAAQMSRAGFHVIGFTIGDLELTAVSDADPGRLRELAEAVRAAQSP